MADWRYEFRLASPLAISLPLLLGALALALPAVWMATKSQLGQWLLEQAWQSSREGLAGEDATPVKPWPWADTHPVGRLRAGTIQGDWIVLAGANGRNLAWGPVRVDRGVHEEVDALLIAGHKDTHFRQLGTLQPGAPLSWEEADGHRWHFVVVTTRVADSRSEWLSLGEGEWVGPDWLVLVTCYPFDHSSGGPLRWVVLARRTASAGPADP